MRLLLSAFLLFASAAPGQVSRPPFEFKDGERILLLGSTIIEREQKFGFLETALSLANPDKKLTVRNLGWSGDTVFGHARSYFGPPEEGIERLAKHLEMIKPTVVITCYGADMPFEGLMKMPDFITAYRKLLDLVRSKSPKVRVIIVAPAPFENLGPPLPDLTDENGKLVEIRDALKGFAAKQAAMFVDSFELMGGAEKERPKQPLTDNGLHYGEAGYKLWSTRVVEALGLPKVDVSTPEATALRQAVVKKDFLFFNRWRPANETYLFGFRKHEQGQNAKEMDQFDPIVAEQEKKIAELKSAALAAKEGALMQEPAPRRPEYWWLAVVPLLVYLVLAQALRENYPFSHYPMYANPTSRPLTFQFVTDGEGNPVKVGSLTGVTPSQVGKTYGERKKEHPSEQDAAMDVLKFLRKQDAYRMGPAMPDRIRLVETSIGFKGNQFVETNRVLAEHQLP